MKKIKHLTEKELLSYAEGSLNKKESQKIGRHLLQCGDCRTALPLPTSTRFLAILTANGSEIKEEVDTRTDFKSFSPVLIYSKITAFMKRPSTIAWSSGAIVLILSATFWLWINSTPINQVGIEVAESYELKNAEIETRLTFEKEKKIEPVSTDEKKERKIPILELNKKVSDSNRIQQKKNLNKQSGNSTSLPKIKQKKISQVLKKDTRIILTTRGGISDCKEEKNLNIEFKPIEKTVVFKWKEVPNAKKYYLYISDDKETLIDEFETDKETSYVLTIALDEAKTYTWKILVILENGETVVGKSEKFTLNDFQMNQKEIKRKNKSQIRCSPKS